MNQTSFKIPGVDPEIEIHGEFPPLYEIIPSITSIHVHDLRADQTSHGEDANQRVIDFTPKINRFWTNFNHAAVSMRDVDFGREGLSWNGARILALSNVASHDISRIRNLVPTRGTGTEESQSDCETDVPSKDGRKGVLPVIAESVVHFTGRTGFVLGRSAFNYYHFLMDTLPMVEVLLQKADEVGLDRIVVNPCEGAPDGFQREVIETLWPEWCERIVFSRGPFRADHLTWCCIWPNLFQRDAAGAVTVGQTPKGASGRLMRRCQGEIFRKADDWRLTDTGTVDPALASAEIVLISRKAASQRQISNEDELFERLAPLGAVQVQMESLSFGQKLRLMGQAKVVIGAHGAGLINAGFCRPGTTCIEITSRTYLPRASWVAKIAWLRDIQYHFAICDEIGDKSAISGNAGNDFRLSEAAINQIAILAEAGVAA